MKKTKILRSFVLLCMFVATLLVATARPAYAATDGGWTIGKPTYTFVNSAQKKIFNKATKKLTGVSYKPVAVIAKQTVAGTNYVYLSYGKTVTAKPRKSWYIVTVSKMLDNRVKLRSIKKLRVKGIKTTENPRTKVLAGGLQVTAVKNKMSALPSGARKAFKKACKKYTGYQLRPIALLGKQVVSGTNYCILCYGRTRGSKDIFVVNVYQKPSGACRITSCKPLNLEKYVN